MADKSSPNSESLPEDESRKDSSSDGGNEDSEGLSTDSEQKEGLAPKEKKGFQRLVAKKDQQIEELKEQLDKHSRKLSEFQKEQRDKKLENLSEAEKWKTIAKENAQKAAEATLSNLVTHEAGKRGLNDHPVVDILLDTPWAIPAVRKRLTDDATWEETIDLVRTHLPSYLDTLVEPESTTPQAVAEPTKSETETPAEGMDTERSGPTEVSKRTWTGAEIKKYLDDAINDPKEYNKRRVEITKAANEGRVVR